MISLRLSRLAAHGSLFAIALWLSACHTPPPPPEPEPAPSAPQKPTGLFGWHGEERRITSIKINVDHQKAYLYQGDKEIGWTYVASGIHSYPTPTGEFKILEKTADKVSNLYGKGYDATGKLINSDFKQGRDLLPAGGKFVPAKMTYWMRLTGDGVGMHIGPIPRPGRRASHGCIRLPAKVAGTIFTNVSIGTPVTIVGNGPSYQTYLKQAAEKSQANAAKLAAAKKKAAEAAAEEQAAIALPPDDPNGPPTAPQPAAPTTPVPNESASLPSPSSSASATSAN
jgi:hypothetical protein